MKTFCLPQCGGSVAARFPQVVRLSSLPVLFIIILLATSTAHAQREMTGAQISLGGSSAIDKTPNLEGLDIPALIKQSSTHGAEMHKLLLDYTYTLKKTKRELDGEGKVRHEGVSVFEAYPLVNQHLLVRLSVNGAPLRGWQLDEERQRVIKSLERAERLREELKRRGKDDDAQRYISVGINQSNANRFISVVLDLSELMRFSDFTEPRREQFGKRDTLVLNFAPRANAEFHPTKAFLAKISGTVWIDVKDRTVVRLEGWQTQDKTTLTAQAAPHEAIITYQQMRMPTGEWFPSLIRMNSNGDRKLFNTLNWDVTFEFSDYRKFSADVNDVKLDSPDKKKQTNP